MQLVGVTLRLAQAWGDSGAVRTAPVPQQAYLTAALAEAVGRLGTEAIEGHPGLLPALLRGVSTRLESPLPPVRCAYVLCCRPDQCPETVIGCNQGIRAPRHLLSQGLSLPGMQQ